MKRFFSFCLLAIIVFLLVACGKPQAYDSQGKGHYFNEYTDKWIVLNYWASWCKPCYEEIPELNRLAVDNRDKLVVLGVNFDQMGAQDIQAFAKLQQVAYPLLVTNPGHLFGINDIPNLPATFLISPKTQQVIALYGPQRAADILEKIRTAS